MSSKKKPSAQARVASHAPEDGEVDPLAILARANFEALAARAFEDRKTGAPSALTPRRAQIILAAKRDLGASDTEAAAMAGVDRTTLSKWLTKGVEGKDPLYVTFVTAYRACKPYFEAVHRGNIVMAARGYPDEKGKPTERRDWRASERLLEWSDPARFGRRLAVTSLPKDFDPAQATDAQLQEIAAGRNPFALPAPPA